MSRWTCWWRRPIPGVPTPLCFQRFLVTSNFHIHLNKEVEQHVLSINHDSYLHKLNISKNDIAKSIGTSVYISMSDKYKCNFNKYKGGSLL